MARRSIDLRLRFGTQYVSAAGSNQPRKESNSIVATFWYPQHLSHLSQCLSFFSSTSNHSQVLSRLGGCSSDKTLPPPAVALCCGPPDAKGHRRVLRHLGQLGAVPSMEAGSSAQGNATLRFQPAGTKFRQVAGRVCRQPPAAGASRQGGGRIHTPPPGKKRCCE